MNVGVTSGGDLFGGTQVTFTDVLGDKQFNMFAASVSQYRTMSFSYMNLSRRFQYALQAYSQTQFYYGYGPGLLFGAAIRLHRSRPRPGDADRPRRHCLRHLPAESIRPPRVSAGISSSVRSTTTRVCRSSPTSTREQYGRTLFSSGTYMPFGVTFVQETTVFREYGPLAGNTIRVGYEFAPMGDLLSRQTADLDARYYMRLGTNGVLALRARGYKSWGEFPGYMYFGGNSEMRGYEYLEFLGNKGFFAQRRTAVPADRGGADADRGSAGCAASSSPTSAARATRGCR